MHSASVSRCVDTKLPLLRVIGDDPLILKQCDVYTEYGLEIIDESSEEYSRGLKVEYPPSLQGCVHELGTHQVKYTIQTPWTDPSSVSVHRTVIVKDVDECSYESDAVSGERSGVTCDMCQPHCSPGASCMNTVGSYTCQCPMCTSGDGFLPSIFRSGTVPEGYKGGNGCTDTCPPVIELFGPPVLSIRTSKCQGLVDLAGLQKKVSAPYIDWEIELTSLLKEGGLSALYSIAQLNTDIIIRTVATDRATLLKGVEDLTDNLIIGMPIRVGPLRWRLPHDVMDAAGNRAVTKFRDIVIVEVPLAPPWARTESYLHSATAASANLASNMNHMSGGVVGDRAHPTTKHTTRSYIVDNIWVICLILVCTHVMAFNAGRSWKRPVYHKVSRRTKKTQTPAPSFS